jgi:hypothetical protein
MFIMVNQSASSAGPASACGRHFLGQPGPARPVVSGRLRARLDIVGH